jgi:hypothetical protein
MKTKARPAKPRNEAGMYMKTKEVSRSRRNVIEKASGYVPGQERGWRLSETICRCLRTPFPIPQTAYSLRLLPSALAGTSHRAGRAGLYRLRRNPSKLSFRGAAGDEESHIALKRVRARFLAPLGMTPWKGFSAACSAPPKSRAFLLFCPASRAVPRLRDCAGGGGGGQSAGLVTAGLKPRPSGPATQNGRAW